MTPKDKAKELVEKFINEFNWVEKDYNVGLYRDTRQCALIAVDEILDVDCCDMSEEYFDNHIEYWEEVKQEIEKL